MKLQLPNVTLMCIDGVSAHRAAKVLEICKEKADFGAVKLLTHLNINNPHRVEIMPLHTLIAYSIWCLTEMYKHFETSHVLCVQRDGWILNTSAWKDSWLNYDYVAPLFVQHDDVGSGGFSLRSKKIMEAAARRIGAWDGTQKHADGLQVNKARSYEDGVLSLTMRHEGIFSYAPKEEAMQFAQGGNKNQQYYYGAPFGFHGDRQEINHESGFVAPVCIHGGQDCACRRQHQAKLLEIEQG